MKELFEGSIKIPRGEAEVRAYCGDIVVDGDKVVAPKNWERDNMVLVEDFPFIGGKRLYVNRKIVEPLRAALTEAEITCPDYKITKIACFAPRPNRNNPKKLSTHCWGIAVDINPDTNPNGPVLITDMPDAFVAAFERCGFRWGGRFGGNKDAMHMQLCEGY